MRHSASRRIASVFALLAIAATVEATPILPADIRVGASVTGSFSFPVSSSPPDQNSSTGIGRYVVADSTAQMVIQAGGVLFPSNPDGLVVEVHEWEFDLLHLVAAGDERTFPFLTGLRGQNPNLDPVGFMALTFTFPTTYSSGDAFPTSIDPLATKQITPIPPSGIYGQVEGASTQNATSAFVEWDFRFAVDPLTMDVLVNDGVLTSTFSGTIYSANLGDRDLEPVPEPSSMILVMSGLLALRKMARRSDSNSPATK